MKVIVIITSIILSPFVCWSDQSKNEQQIVGEALQAIEACLYFGGEIGDQSEERNKALEEGVKKYCPIAKKKTSLAFKRFPNNKKLSPQILALHDFGYFDLTKDQKVGLCRNSSAYFKDEYLRTNFENSFVLLHCPDQAAIIYRK